MVTPNREQQIKSNIKLSIQVSLNGLSFCGFSPAEKRILYFKDIQFSKKLNPIQVLQQIERLYEQEDFLKHQKPEVTVLFSNELYSLVPQQLFDEENASDYLKFNTMILETDYVAHDVLEAAKMVNAYIPYTNVNNFFFDKYGEFEYRHCISILADEFLKLHKEEELGTTVYLNCYTGGGYDLIIIKNARLLLANSFKCYTREDFIYYLLFTAEQLDLDPTQFQLVLLGNIRESSEYYKIAYTYVKNIKFLDTSFGFIFASKEEPPKGYMHYTLLKALE